MSHDAYREQRTFGSLDGIRCFSILAVIWHHTRAGMALGRASTRGFLAVDLFFVLSGFLIVTLLLRERDRVGAISLKAFYARRTLRIFPVYYGVILFSVLLFVVVRQGETGRRLLESLPYLLTYTTNWVATGTLLEITWSLSAEEQFYLLWPPVQKYVPRPLWVLAGLLGLSQVFHFGLADAWFASLGFGPNEPAMLCQTTFTPILLGVLLAHLLHHRGSFDLVARLVGARATPLMSLAAIASLCELAPDDLRGWPRLALHLLMFVFLASCVVREDHALAGLFRLAPIRRLGLLSYGMYLWHMFAADPAARLVERGMPPALSFPVALALTVAIAELSFRFYETPFLSLKHRFAR